VESVTSSISAPLAIYAGFTVSFHNLSIILTRLCRKQIVY